MSKTLKIHHKLNKSGEFWKSYVEIETYVLKIVVKCKHIDCEMNLI